MENKMDKQEIQLSPVSIVEKKQEEDTSRPIRLHNYIMYGIGDVYGGGSFLIIGMLFMFFLTEVEGISPTAAAQIFLIGKLYEAVCDPTIGYLSDSTKLFNYRFGRRRVFLLLGFIPAGISFFCLWLGFRHVVSSEWALVAIHMVFYSFFSSTNSLFFVPYLALNAEMTLNYRERTKLTTYRMLFSMVSVLCGGTLPMLIIDAFPTYGYMVFSGLFGVCFSIAIFTVFIGTWELPFSTIKGQKHSIFKQYLSLFRTRAFTVLLLAYICCYCAIDIQMATTIYWVTYYLHLPSYYPLIMLVLVAFELISIPFFVMKMANSHGMGATLMVSCGVASIGMVIVALPFQLPIPVYFMVVAIMGIGLSGVTVIPFMAVPAASDCDQLVSGSDRPRTGLVSGALALFRKISLGLISIQATGAILSAIGIGAGKEPHYPYGLSLLLGVAPLVFIIGAFLLAMQLRVINPTNMKFVRAELERLKGGGVLDDADEETKRVCTLLTGQPHEKLWSS